MAWLYQLDRAQQASLLANPHGYLPVDIAERIVGHVHPAHLDETPQRPRWHLRSAEANLLEDERLRLDDWWHGLSEEARDDLLTTRHTAVPERHRASVLDLVPGGITPGIDLDVSFRASGIVAAYLEMVHHRQRSSAGGR